MEAECRAAHMNMNTAFIQRILEQFGKITNEIEDTELDHEIDSILHNLLDASTELKRLHSTNDKVNLQLKYSKAIRKIIENLSTLG